jgi:chemotaxis response regulator CheB
VEWRPSQPSFGIYRPASRLPFLWCCTGRRTAGVACLLFWMERTGRLPAEHPRDGEKIRPGRIYVAPPDFHLIVGKGVVHLSRGPKEHHVRPAIDPLFRSAAQAYGQRVIGVLLSGFLYDGVEGLKEIKRNGGLTIVQTPAEAGFPDMPQNALAKVEIDYCVPVAQIRDLMKRLATLRPQHRVRSGRQGPGRAEGGERGGSGAPA